MEKHVNRFTDIILTVFMEFVEARKNSIEGLQYEIVADNISQTRKIPVKKSLRHAKKPEKSLPLQPLKTCRPFREYAGMVKPNNFNKWQ